MQRDIKFDQIYFRQHLQKDVTMLKSILYLCYIIKRGNLAYHNAVTSIYMFMKNAFTKTSTVQTFDTE